MSAGRFKSKDDYFSHRSGLAERVIAAKPQSQPQPKPGRRRGVENAVPAPLLRVHFCKTVESFEITGKGRFRKGDYPLDDAVQSHLDGETTLLVNPLTSAGETAFTVVRFDLSEAMDHPFSKARQYADELQKFGVSGLIEVTEGGKGHYHLWIFHEQPIPAVPFSEALIRLGHRLFGVNLETVPPLTGNASIPLPLQGESVLLQRRVFVNAVGKMIKEQATVLQNIEYCPKLVSDGLIARMSAAPIPAPSSRQQSPEIPPRPAPSVTASPAAMPLVAAPPVTVPPADVPAVPVAPVTPQPSVTAPVENAAVAPATIPAEPVKSIPAVEKPKPPVPAEQDSPELELIFPEKAAIVPVSAAPAAPVESPDLIPPETASVPSSVSVPENTAEIAAQSVPEAGPEVPREPAVSQKSMVLPEPMASPEYPDVPDAAPVPPLSVLVFRRNDLECGIPVDLVETITAVGGMTSRPGAGKGVLGNLISAGRTIAVLDIGAVNGGTPPYPPRARVIILKARAGEMGLLADTVSGVMTLPAERIAPSTGDTRFRSAAELPGSGRTILIPDLDGLAALAAGEPRRAEDWMPIPISPEPHVLFSGGGGRYALPARSVREILPEPLPTAGPGGGKTAKTVPWRGQSLPVVEIPPLSGRADAAGTRKSAPRGRILVLRADERLFGVRVDAVSGIRTLPSGSLEPAAGGLAPVLAVVRLEGAEGSVQVLDPEQMGRFR